MKLFKTLSIVMFFANFTFLFSKASEYKNSFEYVTFVLDSLISIAKDKKTNPGEKRVKIASFIDSEYDLKYATKFVLGQSWRNISVEQRKEFFEVYKNYVISTYYGSIVPALQKKDTVIKVSENIIENTTSQQVNINFKTKDENGETKESIIGILVKKNNDKFQIIDINYANLSFLQSQRDEFNSIISSQGFDELILRLKDSGEPKNINKKQTSK